METLPYAKQLLQLVTLPVSSPEISQLPTSFEVSNSSAESRSDVSE